MQGLGCWIRLHFEIYLALVGSAAVFISGGVRRNMQQIARTSIRAAPTSITASAKFNAFVAFTAWASSLRSTSGVAVVAPPSNTAVKRTAYRRRLPLR